MENARECLIPAVNGEYKEGKGSFMMPEAFAPAGFDAGAENVFAKRLGRMGNYTMAAGNTEILTVEVRKTDDRQVNPDSPESYSLLIGETGVHIVISACAGYHRALETLFILIATGNGTAAAVRYMYKIPRWRRLFNRAP